MTESERTAVLVVGAGPCGLAVAVAATDSGVGCIVVDRGPVETTVPGLFIAGVIAAGKDGNRIFIENGRLHGARILQHLKPAVVDGV